MGVIRHTWDFKKRFSILNLQYVNTELSYDDDFLHMTRTQQKQQIDTVTSSGLLTA